MKNEKLSKILTNAVLMILGVLIAVFGTKAIDIYLGVIACIVGVVILVDAIYLISKKQKVVAYPFVASFVFLTIGITLFVGWISFNAVVNFLVTVVLGAGAGLLCYGIYLFSEKEKNSGLLNVVMGVVALTLAILYMAVTSFQGIFWIITGIVIAVYGLLGLVFIGIEKKK